MKHRTLFILLAAACAELPDVPLDGRCGNEIREPSAGEDCDTHTAEPGTTCGLPNTPAACRYVCATSVCPTGWRCGADDICRASAGRLGPPEAFNHQSALPQLAELADFDLDGNLDLATLEPTAIAVRYGNGNAGFLATSVFAVARPEGLAAYGDVTGDGAADVVLPDQTGLVVARGQGNRVLEPIEYPLVDVGDFENVRLVSARVIPQRIDPVMLAFASDGTDTRLIVVDDDFGGEGSDPLMNFEGTYAESVAVGNVDVDAQDEIVVSFAGEADVRVLHVECTEAMDELSCLVTEGAPIDVMPNTVRRGVRLGDINGDGDLDVVVSVDTPAGPAPVVSQSNGMGLFMNPIAVPTVPVTCDVELCLDGLFPLAMADFNGDQRADLVYPIGIWAFDGMFPNVDGSFIARSGAISLWTEAVVADFNRDGRNDVAAATSGAGIDFLIGSGRGTLTPSFVPTPGAPSGLRTGDFDGDNFLDVAFVAGGELLVAFGRPDGAPREAVSMGAVDAQQIIAGVELDESGDVISDIAVYDGRAITQFSGAASRRMLATFDLPGTPRLPIRGFFDDDERADLLVVTGELSFFPPSFESEPFLLTGRADAAFAAVENPATVGCPVVDPRFVSCPTYVVTNLDDDPAQEIVADDSARPCANEVIDGLDQVLAGAPALPPVILDPTPSGFACRPLEVPNTEWPTRVVTADFDADGAIDIAIAYEDGLAVYWSAEAAVEVYDDVVLSLTPIDLGNNRIAVVVATPDGIEVGHLGRDGFVADTVVPLAVDRETKVLAADLVGDRFEDLVVVSSGALYVLEQEICDARSVNAGLCTRPEAQP